MQLLGSGRQPTMMPRTVSPTCPILFCTTPKARTPSSAAIWRAASAGLYETGVTIDHNGKKVGGMKVPRIQILTAAQILDGRRPQVPLGTPKASDRPAVR